LRGSVVVVPRHGVVATDGVPGQEQVGDQKRDGDNPSPQAIRVRGRIISVTAHTYAQGPVMASLNPAQDGTRLGRPSQYDRAELLPGSGFVPENGGVHHFADRLGLAGWPSRSLTEPGTACWLVTLARGPESAGEGIPGDPESFVPAAPSSYGPARWFFRRAGATLPRA
jgi:hypothetical protein